MSKTNSENIDPRTCEERPGGISLTALAVLTIAIVIVIDQSLKFWIKTRFYLGEDYEIFPWFHLKFIENNGMAFGMELGSKVALTLGRIVAVGVLIWALCKLRTLPGLRKGFIVALSLVTAGAAGNIFDCLFYGLIFNNPAPPATAVLFPAEGGYADLFYGRVVDMLYFPLFSFYWPAWVPVLGGQYYEFFQYIFNIADSAICIGFFLLIIFYSRDVSVSYNHLRECLRRKTKSTPE